MVSQATDNGRSSQLERFIASELAGDVTVDGWSRLTGGYSCQMEEFTATIDGLPHRFVARADPPPGRAWMSTDRDREWAVVSALSAAEDLPLPRAHLYDRDGSALGAKTMILDHVAGEVLTDRLRATDESDWQPHADALCDLITTIHAVDLEVLPSEIERPATWDEHFDASIQVWRDLEAAHPEPLPELRFLTRWLEAHRPPPAPLVLVHGDFQAGNVMVRPDGSLVAVDWELARVGDPREDLGWFRMTHAVNPPDLIGANAQRFCERYRASTGLDAAVINPLTVIYFEILPAGRPLALFLERMRSLAAGDSPSALSAYQVEVVSALVQVWIAAARAIDVALPSGWEVAA